MPTVSETEVVLALVMLAGLVGVLVPVLPGLLLIGGAAIAWAVVDDPGSLGWAAVVVIVVIGVVGLVAPSWLSARRARGAGLPAWVMVAGVVGAIVGFFAIPVVGALLGWPAGVFVAELVRRRRTAPAWRSTVEALKGLGMGLVVQFVAGVVMIAVWALAAVAT